MNKEERILKTRERAKKWVIYNQDKYKKNETNRVTCECGSNIRKRELSEHKKTKKHQAYDFLKCIEENLSTIISS